MIAEYRESANSILLIAEKDGEWIGNIDLTGSKRAKMFHTGMIALAIAEGWRNQGVGKCLMKSVMDWAKAQPAIELLWLYS